MTKVKITRGGRNRTDFINQAVLLASYYSFDRFERYKVEAAAVLYSKLTTGGSAGLQCCLTNSENVTGLQSVLTIKPK